MWIRVISRNFLKIFRESNFLSSIKLHIKIGTCEASSYETPEEPLKEAHATTYFRKRLKQCLSYQYFDVIFFFMKSGMSD